MLKMILGSKKTSLFLKKYWRVVAIFLALVVIGGGIYSIQREIKSAQRAQTQADQHSQAVQLIAKRFSAFPLCPSSVAETPCETNSSGVSLSPHFHQDPTTTVASNIITFHPGILPLSDAELGNPQRGAQYYGGEAPPSDWPQADMYERWCWSSLETNEGQYDFSLIDQKLAEAKAAGYTFSFRIMPVNPSKEGSCIPHYLMDRLPLGFTQNGIYIPDYNDIHYLERARALFNALAQRYNDDPRLGWLDMSLYGCWGEWNSSCVSYPSSTGAVPMTVQNRETLIDLQVQAFSKKRFLMLTAEQDSLDYALQLQRALPIGVRIDCLGSEGLGGARNNLNTNTLERERWRVAPLYFEYCSQPDFQQSLADIVTYHASVVGDGDGNINPFNSYSAHDQALLQENFKVAGYRLLLDKLSLPEHLQSGSSFTLSTLWSNINVAPVYMPWKVQVQFRSDDNRIVWQTTSQFDMQKLFPTIDLNGADTPIAFKEQCALPNTLAAGKYNVTVQIADPTGYYRPLALAIQGRQSDGSYPLGQISVD